MLRIVLAALALAVFTTGSASARSDIVETADSAGSFTTLLAAAEAAGLVETLRGDGPLTVLAPTDEAFAAIPEETLAALLEPSARDQLRSILLLHVIPGRLSAGELLAAGSARTAQSADVRFALTNGQLTVGPARVVGNDIDADNGVIHVIDRVLLPPVRSARAFSPLGIIDLAIERGAPLYNAGEHAACAAVYEVTVSALADLTRHEIDDATRRELRTALRTMRSHHDPDEQAWILRRALDRTAHALMTRRDG